MLSGEDEPRVIRAARKSRVLTPSALACLSTLPTINLTSGCLHDCAYCYIRGYSGYPGRGRAILYDDIPDRLERELSRSREKPKAVYFSPSSDLFQPDPAILECAVRTLQVLFRHGVGVAFLSKGVIPDVALRMLERHPALVQAQVGLLAVDDQIAQTFEPGAASPGTRLAQMRRLVTAGISTAVRVDPVLPGITDGDDLLRGLFAAVRSTGVTAASLGILFTRSGITSGLRLATGPMMAAVPGLLARFRAHESIEMRRAGTRVGVLPDVQRREILERVQRHASEQQITVRVCACKNPDIASGSCNIAGTWRSSSVVQGRLGIQAERR